MISWPAVILEILREREWYRIQKVIKTKWGWGSLNSHPSPAIRYSLPMSDPSYGLRQGRSNPGPAPLFCCLNKPSPRACVGFLGLGCSLLLLSGFQPQALLSAYLFRTVPTSIPFFLNSLSKILESLTVIPASVAAKPYCQTLTIINAPSGHLALVSSPPLL